MQLNRQVPFERKSVCRGTVSPVYQRQLKSNWRQEDQHMAVRDRWDLLVWCSFRMLVSTWMQWYCSHTRGRHRNQRLLAILRLHCDFSALQCNRNQGQKNYAMQCNWVSDCEWLRVIIRLFRGQFRHIPIAIQNVMISGGMNVLDKVCFSFCYSFSFCLWIVLFLRMKLSTLKKL